MTPAPTPTWYDVLDVPRDADPDQIKSAWREATDRFEPGSGSGQFRMFNEAANVLLDTDQRRQYDAALNAERTPGPVLAKTPVPPPPAPLAAREEKPRGIARAVVAGLGRLNLLTLGIIAVLTAAVLVAAAVIGVKVHQEGNVIDARDQAPAAAERAAKAVLAYDYRTLPADRKRATPYLTDRFRPKYLQNFTLLEKQKDGTPGVAVQTKTVVTSSVLGSGVMDAEDGVVRVLVYVNQTSTRPGKDPQIFQNRVAMTMEAVGNRWLVDDLKSY